MKKIFFTLLCAAVMISCGGNKEKTTACDGNHAECTHQHDECDGNHEDCTGECENGVGECDHCTSKGEAEKCTNQEAGVVVLDTETFIKKVADINNPEWKYLGDKPAIVDFYADWCGPCRMVAPILEEIAKEKAGELYVYKVNVDNSPELANHFNVASIPTLLFIPMSGEPVAQVGAMQKDALVELIGKTLK